MAWFDTLLYPFKVAIAWLWIVLHDMFVALGLSESASWVWGIVGITVLVRAVVLPLTFKAVRSGRAMSAMQSDLKRIKEKYKGRTDAVSKQQMNQETMALYKEHGANPMASCFPMLVQFPVLIALYRVLADATPIAAGTYAGHSLGPLTRAIAQKIEVSTFAGAPLSASFTATHDTHVRVVAVVLVAIYVVLMFLSQAWLGTRNIARGNDQAMRMMRIMGYLMPIMMAFIGVSLQIGVLVYWMVTMLFSFLQQAAILYYLPTPESPAHDSMLKRNRKTYDKFEERERSGYESYIRDAGLSDQEIAQAQSRIVKARVKGDQDDTLGDDERAQKLRDAARVREEHQDKLRKKRIKLELEAAPAKKRDPNKRTLMERLLEAQKKNQERQANVEAGTRNQAAQPKNRSRAQRQAEAKKRKQEAKQNRSADLSAEEIERRRRERKRRMRQNRKRRK